MAKGYPSKSRARRAFERGCYVGFHAKRFDNPYAHPVLAKLWERGRRMGESGRRPKLKTPSKVARVAPAPRPHRHERRRELGGRGWHGASRRGGWR